MKEVNKMATEQERRLFKQTIEKWGIDAQGMMAIEEMAELTKALCKVKRKGYTYTAESILPLYEELADVRLMLDQLDYIFNFSDVSIRQQKLARLEALLNEKHG